MLKTIRSKILFLIVLLMSITTVSIILITKRNFEKEYQKVHAELTRLVQRFGVLALENEHREAMQRKVQTVIKWRELQQHMTESVHAMLDFCYSLYKDGTLTEEQAQQRSLDWLVDFRYGDTSYFFAYDKNFKGLAHPFSPLLGKSWRGFSDAKLQDALPAMRRAVLEKEVEHAVFFWPRLSDGALVKQLGYFSYYPKWDWVIGTAIEMQQLEQDSLRIMEAVRRKFTNIFQAEHFADTGYIFVMDGAGNLIVHPARDVQSLSDMQDGVSGELLLERFESAVHNEEELLEFSFDGSQAPEDLQLAYVRYFKAFDWYVAASMYKEAVLAPAKRLIWRQSSIIFGIFILGVLIATVISQRISRHISLFAQYARQLPERNLADEGALPDFPVLSRRLDDEVGQLEHAFHFMETQLRKNMREVKAYQEHLEDRVTRRTKELSESNALLQNEIFERTKIEKELSRIQNLLSDIVNSMPSILIGVDEQICVTQWNREAEKCTSIPAAKAQGCELFELLPQLSGEREKMLATIHFRQFQSHERVALSFGAYEGFADIIIYPLIAESGEGAVIRIDDVSERMRLEEMMIQSEKMLSVGGLAAGMAHEINNPLGIILQSLQNISRRLSHKLEANLDIAKECGIQLEALDCYLEKRHITRHLDGARAAGLRAAKIVSNMLNFSRRSDADKLPTDMRRLLEESLELAANDYSMKKQHNFKGIEVLRDYDDSLPPVPCVATEIEQVILNLLKNAAQALSDVQDASDRPQIRLTTRQENGYALVSVADNGPGMSRNIRKQIFDPFFTTKAVGQGTGLGLSVSYFIINAHHQGTITVDSSPGKGATFTLHLPITL